MFIKYSNYLDDIPEGNINKTLPVFINSCGTYQLSDNENMTTERPQGRNDYQLIYIASGKGIFYFDLDSPTILKAGNIVIYHPTTMQKYIYYGKDNPEIYWIHFSGKEPEKILKNYGFTDKQLFYFVGTDTEYTYIFEQIIFELQCKKSFYVHSTATLFQELLISFGRFYLNNTTLKKPLFFHQMDKAAAFFYAHFNENIDVEAYISEHETDLCPSLFYRQFKEYSGQTPLQYIIDIRLQTAKRLLETTNYSISEISRSVGYDNPLYFSRLFHKHLGISPREYRTNSQNAQT